MRFARIGICIGALAFGGCTSTVQLPATELPTLSTPSVQAGTEWPEVRTVAGPPEKIIGTIERIEISGNQGSEPIQLPFTARVNGPNLEVFGPAGFRGFPLTEDLRVSVEYNDLKKRRSITGGVLIGVGAPILIGGIALFGLGIDIAGRGDGIDGLITGFAGGLLMLGGTIGIAGGLGMVIPGIVFVATDPKKPVGDTARIQPKLQIGPTGVDLSVKF